MKYFLAIIFVYVSSSLGDLDRIATINKHKKEAKVAYNKGDYKTAIRHYKYLLDSMEVKDDNILLNLANAYYQAKDTTNALSDYQSLTGSENKLVKSVAELQLGIMANRSKKFKEALEHFKQALKADPTNEDARYNYELLKKVLKEQEQNQDKNKDDQKNQDNKDQQDKDKKDQDQQKGKDQNKENQDKEQENKDQQDQDQKKDGEGEEKEQKDQDQKKDKGEKKDAEKKDTKEQKKPQDGEKSDEKSDKKDQMNSVSDKLKEMNISEEKAQMILEALKNKEIQYYQQNKRKASKRTDSSKPDW